MMGRPGKPFRPFSGTEGAVFEQEWCMMCKRDQEWYEYEINPCEIHNAALMYDIDEPDYPVEWKYNSAGLPSCSAFVKINTDCKCCGMPRKLDKDGLCFICTTGWCNCAKWCLHRR